MVFVGVLFGSLAMIVTSVAPSFDFFSYYTELVITPMLFFSGRLLPARQLPRLDEDAGRGHAPDPRRPHLPGALHRRARDRGSGWSLAGLAVLAAVVFTVSTRMMRKRLIK
ncbi:MAG: ABC transporter permease [Candidatus Moduliflexus flocculans]|nr:ABC transporter permease [Candidatus Moduliflexus flocculans]